MENEEVILFTRAQKIKELNPLARFLFWYKGTQPEDPLFRTDYVLPEALIVKVYMHFKEIIRNRYSVC